MAGFVPIPIFEALHELAHGLRIARHGPRPVVDWRPRDGGSREQGLSGVVWQRHAEAGADRRRDEIDLGEAGAASPWFPTRVRQATQTGGRRRLASWLKAEVKAAAPLDLLAGSRGRSSEISASPVDMDAMIERKRPSLEDGMRR